MDKSEPQPEFKEELERLTKKIAKGGGFAFFGKIFGQLLGFIFQILLGRFLGAIAYGLYALGASIVNLTGRISMLGLENGLVRFVPLYEGEERKENTKGVLFLALTISTITGVLIFLMLFLFSDSIATKFFHKPILSDVIKIFSITVPIYVFMSMVQSGIRGFQRIDHGVMVALFHHIIRILILSVVFFLGFRLYGAVFTFAFSILLSAILAVYFLKKIFPELTTLLKPKFETKRLLRFSIPLYLAGFTYLLMTRIDIFMIGYFLQTADVGIYYSAVALTALTRLPLVAFNTAFAPMISDLHNRGRLDELKKLFKTGTRWITTGNLLIVLLLLLFSKEFLGLWGVEFKAAQFALSVLILSQVVNAAVGSAGFMLIMSGHQDYILFNNFFTLALNIFLNIRLIPVFGILGAALATGISLIINNLLCSIEVYKTLKMHPWNKDYLRITIPIILSLTGYLLFQILGIPWFVNVMAVTIIFGSGFFSFGMADEDRIVVAAIKKKIYRQTL